MRTRCYRTLRRQVSVPDHRLGEITGEQAGFETRLVFWFRIRALTTPPLPSRIAGCRPSPRFPSRAENVRSGFLTSFPILEMREAPYKGGQAYDLPDARPTRSTVPSVWMFAWDLLS